MRLVFVTQQVDPDHPVLGAAVAKIRALATLADEVDVLALRAVAGALPPNCRVLTFGAPTQALRGTRYLAAVTRVLARRPAALLAHMSPVYAWLGAPIAHRVGARVFLWYTQQTTNAQLERTERVVDAIFTVDVQSFPYESNKVRPIGHGIDVEAFSCLPPPPAGARLRLLGLGRYAPVKRWDVAVRAIAELPDAELVVHGPEATAADRKHRLELDRQVALLGIEDRVRFAGPVPHRSVLRVLEKFDALLNPTRSGAADKVVFEAAAACRLPLAASAALAGFLPSELRFDDGASLAQRLRAFRDLDRAALAHTLRQRVVAEHSAEHWARAIVEAVA